MSEMLWVSEIQVCEEQGLARVLLETSFGQRFLGNAHLPSHRPTFHTDLHFTQTLKERAWVFSFCIVHFAVGKPTSYFATFY